MADVFLILVIELLKDIPPTVLPLGLGTQSLFPNPKAHQDTETVKEKGE